jgi:beta-glucosidase
MQQFQSGFGASLGGDQEQNEMFAAMMRYMPLRALVSFSRGALTEEMLDQLLAQLNQASA